MQRFDVLATSEIVAGGSVVTEHLQTTFEDLAHLGSALHEGSRRLIELATLRLSVKSESAMETFSRLHSGSVYLQKRIGEVLTTAQSTGILLFTHRKSATKPLPAATSAYQTVFDMMIFSGRRLPECGPNLHRRVKG